MSISTLLPLWVFIGKRSLPQVTGFEWSSSGLPQFALPKLARVPIYRATRDEGDQQLEMPTRMNSWVCQLLGAGSRTEHRGFVARDAGHCPKELLASVTRNFFVCLFVCLLVVCKLWVCALRLIMFVCLNIFFFSSHFVCYFCLWSGVPFFPIHQSLSLSTYFSVFFPLSISLSLYIYHLVFFQSFSLCLYISFRFFFQPINLSLFLHNIQVSF